MRARSGFGNACVIATVLCAALTACSSQAPVEGSVPESLIYDERAGRVVSESELVEALSLARYRLLGEIHDNPAHHVVRARLISRLAARGVRAAVVFEQFDLDNDQALRAAQAAGADAEQLAEAGRLDRKAWSWPMHKTILEAALSAHLPVRAANLPRAVLRGDLRALDHDATAAWYARFHAASWTDAQGAELRADIVESHCGKLPEVVVPRLVLAQRMRDAAMAQALVDAATADGAILIAGDGHVRADLGVPVYLHARGMPDAGAPSLSVGFVEASPAEEAAPDFPQGLVAAHPGLDFVVFTPPMRREDPCAAL
ncbi:MAG TPA: ChaN family lipoprotein [Casimicrobiaceae bacterium]|nr:ChaN family lipoprotein [Casimicrobiaceae bacterium]